MKEKAICILILVLVIILIPITSFCDNRGSNKYDNSASKPPMDDAVNDGKNFLSSGKDFNTVINTEKLKNTSGEIFNVIYAIGMVIAVATGTVLGIKFMLAPIEEKAETKQALLPYAIGCIVLFGAITIWRVAVSILGKI